MNESDGKQRHGVRMARKKSVVDAAAAAQEARGVALTASHRHELRRPRALIEAADTLSDIQVVKHALRAGVKAEPPPIFLDTNLGLNRV